MDNRNKNKTNTERKVWKKPEILRAYSEEELDELMRGHDLRVHGAGTFSNGSFRNKADS
jgi:hypothetical protein